MDLISIRGTPTAVAGPWPSLAPSASHAYDLGLGGRAILPPNPSVRMVPSTELDLGHPFEGGSAVLDMPSNSLLNPMVPPSIEPGMGGFADVPANLQISESSSLLGKRSASDVLVGGGGGGGREIPLAKRPRFGGGNPEFEAEAGSWAADAMKAIGSAGGAAMGMLRGAAVRMGQFVAGTVSVGAAGRKIMRGLLRNTFGSSLDEFAKQMGAVASYAGYKSLVRYLPLLQPIAAGVFQGQQDAQRHDWTALFAHTAETGLAAFMYDRMVVRDTSTFVQDIVEANTFIAQTRGNLYWLRSKLIATATQAAAERWTVPSLDEISQAVVTASKMARGAALEAGELSQMTGVFARGGLNGGNVAAQIDFQFERLISTMTPAFAEAVTRAGVNATGETLKFGQRVVKGAFESGATNPVDALEAGFKEEVASQFTKGVLEPIKEFTGGLDKEMFTADNMMEWVVDGVETGFANTIAGPVRSSMDQVLRGARALGETGTAIREGRPPPTEEEFARMVGGAEPTASELAEEAAGSIEGASESSRSLFTEPWSDAEVATWGRHVVSGQPEPLGPIGDELKDFSGEPPLGGEGAEDEPFDPLRDDPMDVDGEPPLGGEGAEDEPFEPPNEDVPPAEFEPDDLLDGGDVAPISTDDFNEPPVEGAGDLDIDSAGEAIADAEATGADAAAIAGEAGGGGKLLNISVGNKILAGLGVAFQATTDIIHADTVGDAIGVGFADYGAGLVGYGATVAVGTGIAEAAAATGVIQAGKFAGPVGFAAGIVAAMAASTGPAIHDAISGDAANMRDVIAQMNGQVPAHIAKIQAELEEHRKHGAELSKDYNEQFAVFQELQASQNKVFGPHNGPNAYGSAVRDYAQLPSLAAMGQMPEARGIFPPPPAKPKNFGDKFVEGLGLVLAFPGKVMRELPIFSTLMKLQDLMGEGFAELSNVIRGYTPEQVRQASILFQQNRWWEQQLQNSLDTRGHVLAKRNIILNRIEIQHRAIQEAPDWVEDESKATAVYLSKHPELREPEVGNDPRGDRAINEHYKKISAHDAGTKQDIIDSIGGQSLEGKAIAAAIEMVPDGNQERINAWYEVILANLKKKAAAEDQKSTSSDQSDTDRTSSEGGDAGGSTTGDTTKDGGGVEPPTTDTPSSSGPEGGKPIDSGSGIPAGGGERGQPVVDGGGTAQIPGASSPLREKNSSGGMGGGSGSLDSAEQLAADLGLPEDETEAALAVDWSYPDPDKTTDSSGLVVMARARAEAAASAKTDL